MRLRRALALTLCLSLPAIAQGDPHGDALKGEFKARVEGVERRLEAWDVPGAKVELSALERVAPQDAEPVLYYRGRIAFEEGRYAEAVDLLERAGVGDAGGSYLRLAKDTLEIVGKDQHAESAHFVFFYPKGKDAVLAPWALETLEAIRAAMEQELGWAPPGKVRVEIVNDAGELAKVSTLTVEQIHKTGTIAICKFNKLMVTSPKAAVFGYDWQDTLAHELIHLVVSQLSGNTVPIWLHEGIAKYFETRWRGAAGQAMTPPLQALLGKRVKQDTLIPFAKMHPSIALLPTAEDAATAFAEVFYAIDLLEKEWGPQSLRTLIGALRDGKTDKAAVEAATGKSFPAFEKAWLAHIRKQKFPLDLLPMTNDLVVLKDDQRAKGKGPLDDKKRKGREISFGEFDVVQEPEAQRFAHLGELMRERNRPRAAAEELGKAWQIVGDKYEVVSNKYALALFETGNVAKAEEVLAGSLKLYPGTASTLVHLGRVYVARRDFQKAKQTFLQALSVDPFDPEIHLTLVAVAGQLKEPALVARAREASVILMGLEPKQVDVVAHQLLRRSGAALASADVTPDTLTMTPGSPPGSPAPPRPDGGPPDDSLLKGKAP